MWVYWRLYVLSTVVMLSIYNDASSLTCPRATEDECVFHTACERVVFLALLASLLILHAFWFYKLVRLGYKQLFTVLQPQQQ